MTRHRSELIAASIVLLLLAATPAVSPGVSAQAPMKLTVGLPVPPSPGNMWLELAKADLLGICIPERDGGGGFGLIEACLIAEQIGRTVAPVPYLPTIVGAGLPLAEFGTDAQRARYLPGLIDLIWNRTIDPGKVFDLALPLDAAAEAYRAMDERRAIKALLRI